jgi:hypothetical protein
MLQEEKMIGKKPVYQVVRMPQPGYIYLVSAIGTNKFKIGKTCVSVAHRIDVLQTGCPIRLRYVYHAYVRDISQVEKELHRQFACFRNIGEWFTFSHADVQECITLMRLVQIDEPLSSLSTASFVELTGFGCAELRERIHQLQARGYGKAKIILEIWGVSKGGSPKYKAAEAEYRRVLGEA